MELALNFGIPFEQLRQTMTEREFQSWAEYRNRRRMPLERLELYLAQIACWCARTTGANGSINDFMIEFVSAPSLPEGTSKDLAEAVVEFGFSPRFKKEKG